MSANAVSTTAATAALSTAESSVQPWLLVDCTASTRATSPPTTMPAAMPMLATVFHTARAAARCLPA
jgi:hypothetical protein